MTYYNISDRVAKAVDTAVAIAGDNTHGYDQVNRWGPDYDCSSLIGYCLKVAGFDIPNTFYTGNARDNLIHNGFSIIPFRPDVALQRGDIVVNTDHHMVLMISSDRCISATINEKGTISGGKTGDQTGTEIYDRKFYIPGYGWDFIARYTMNGVFNMEQVFSFLPVLKLCSTGNDVRIVQACLSYHLKRPELEIDGVFGQETRKAVIDFQKLVNIQADGVVGNITYNALFNQCSW